MFLFFYLKYFPFSNWNIYVSLIEKISFFYLAYFFVLIGIFSLFKLEHFLFLIVIFFFFIRTSSSSSIYTFHVLIFFISSSWCYFFLINQKNCSLLAVMERVPFLSLFIQVIINNDDKKIYIVWLDLDLCYSLVCARNRDLLMKNMHTLDLVLYSKASR